MSRFRRILVSVDGSETSEKALEAAVELASDAGGRLLVVHSIESLAVVSGFETSVEVVELLHDQGQDIIDHATAKARAAGVEAESALFELDSRRLGELIAEEAQNWSADLVVLGSQGRRGLSRLLLGSGAEEILRLATVPVLVIRTPGSSSPAANS